MIKVYKNRIVVFSKNYKRVFMYSLKFDSDGDASYWWEDKNCGDVISHPCSIHLKIAIKISIQYISEQILYAHCSHTEVPCGNWNRCNKCGRYLTKIK